MTLSSQVLGEPARLVALDLRPGPWLQRVRGPQAEEEETVIVGGETHRLKGLQDALVIVTPGGLAYLTDFRLDDAATERLAKGDSRAGMQQNLLVLRNQHREHVTLLYVQRRVSRLLSSMAIR